MSSPGPYNLCIYQGATLSLVFIWSAGQCCGCGAVGSASGPVDLTGYTATLQIRPFAGSSTLYFDASPYLFLGGVAGTISLTIPAALTETFTWITGVYDLLLADSSNNVTPLLTGSASVTTAVST